MRIKIKSIEPKVILQNVQDEMFKDKAPDEIKKLKKEFDLFAFCKVYKHQAELPQKNSKRKIDPKFVITWDKIGKLFAFLKQKRLTINYLQFTLPEKEEMKNGADSENKRQMEQNRGLATVVSFLMQDRQIGVLEERTLLWINKNHPSEVIRENAKNKVINGNKKLLFYLLKKRRFKIDHDEGQMLTEGYMEMCSSFHKFKPESNYKFMSYVQWGVIQAMEKCICKEMNTIELPPNVRHQIYKLNKFIEEYGRDKLNEFQKENKVSDKTLNVLMKYRDQFGYVASTESLVDTTTGKNIPLDNLIGESETPKTIAIHNEFDDVLKETLTNDEYLVIVNLFGIGCDKITKTEISRKHPMLALNDINKLYKSAMAKLSEKKEILAQILE